MKMKIGKHIDFEFDKDDAKIVIPIIIGGTIYWYEAFLRIYCMVFLVAYYALYFYAGTAWAFIAEKFKKVCFRCPNCRSRKLILQGYQSYKSDEQHAFYLCLECDTTSIETVNGLHSRK